MNISLDEVAKKAAEASVDPRIRAWAIECLERARRDGASVKNPMGRAKAILSAVQKKLWVPDPVGTEWMAGAHLTACIDPKAPCFHGGDCDDLAILLGASMSAVGIPTLIVGHAYDVSKSISHVLCSVHVSGQWMYADPSTSMPLGECVSFTRERILSIPNVQVVCDANTCLGVRAINPDVVEPTDAGIFVGVNGLPEGKAIWYPEVVTWLGDAKQLIVQEAASQTPCGTPPPNQVTTDTVEDYAVTCGKEAVLKWIGAETGLNVAGCADKAIKDIPDCITENYGVTIYVVNPDGSVNWQSVVQDAGAVVGIAVCAYTGVLAVAAPVCGIIGGKIAGAIYEVVTDLFSKVTTVDCTTASVFPAGLYDSGMWILNYLSSHSGELDFPLPSSTMAYYEQGTPFGFTVGTVSANPYAVWSTIYVRRVLKMRAMAQATASLAREVAKKSGCSPADAIGIMKPDAPPGWSSVLRPELRTLMPGYYDDVLMSTGMLLDMFIDMDAVFVADRRRIPEAYKDQPNLIVPSWDKEEFWSGIDPVGRIDDADTLFRQFQLRVECPYGYQISWNVVGDQKALRDMIKNTPKDLAKRAVDRPDEGVSFTYGMPNTIEAIVDAVQLSENDFDALMIKWAKSIDQQNYVDNIKKGKVVAAAKNSSKGAVLLVVGAAATAAAMFLVKS